MRSRGIIAPDDEKIISFYGILDGMGEKMDNIIFNPGNANENDVKKFFEPVEIFLSSFPTRAIETKETAAIIDDSPDSPIKVPVDVVIVDYALCRNDSIFQRSVPIIGFISSPAFVFANKLAVNESTPELPNDAFFSPWEHIVGGPIPKFYKAQVAHYNKVLPLFKAFVFNSVAEMEPSSTTLLRESPLTSGTPALFVGKRKLTTMAIICGLVQFSGHVFQPNVALHRPSWSKFLALVEYGKLPSDVVAIFEAGGMGAASFRWRPLRNMAAEFVPCFAI